VDPDALSWANIGRHVLGAEFVGKNKAEALARQISKRLPHLKRIEAVSEKWQQVMRSSPEMLTDIDLIISTMGDWSSECQLNAWHRAQAANVPVLYGWTEAYGCAGHAVSISPGESCLQCGFSSLGVPLLPVAFWANGSTVRLEPA